MQNSIKIAVFDFDYTIINANSTTYLNKLVIQEELLENKLPIRTPSIAELNRYKYPEEIEKYKNEKNFTLFYEQVFKCMHSKYGITKDKMEKCLKEIVINESMKNLFKFLNENEYELIIVSDSNTFVITQIIEHNKLTNYFSDRIFANKLEFGPNGQISMIPCTNRQNVDAFNCVRETCRENICKRYVVDKYLSEKKNCSISKIIYVGDGKIDYCPGVGLRHNDIFFVKKNSSLDRFLKEKTNSNKIKADIKYWKNGNDILNNLI